LLHRLPTQPHAFESAGVGSTHRATTTTCRTSTGEYIKIHNYCSTAKYLTGWHVNDYGNKHRYAVPSGFKLGAYATVTLYSGTGTRTSTRLYWNRSYGAVWNNTPPERAYLRNSAGTLVSSWSSY